MANFEAFHWNISSSTNSEFGRSGSVRRAPQHPSHFCFPEIHSSILEYIKYTLQMTNTLGLCFFALCVQSHKCFTDGAFDFLVNVLNGTSCMANSYQNGKQHKY